MKLLYIPMYMAVLFLMGCNKSKDLPRDPSKLKQVTNNIGLLVYDFTYDQQGRLSHLTSQNLMAFTALEYMYEGNNTKISSCKILETQTGYEALKNFTRHFSYDDKDRLVMIELKKNSPSAPDPTGVIYGSRCEFEYRQSGDKYSSCIIYCKNQTGEFPYRKVKFWYDLKGNLGGVQNSSYSSGEWKQGFDTYYFYSGVPNPFYRNTDPLDFENYVSKQFWVKTKSTNQVVIGFPVTDRECILNGSRLERSIDNLRNTTDYEYY